MKDIKRHIENLIEKAEEELALATVQEWIYQREYADPKHITKAKAEESLGIFQKRIKYLEQNIEVYKLYMEENNV